METNLEELLNIIAKQTIVLNRQDKGLIDLTAAYNAKADECQKLQTELETLKKDSGFLKEVTG